jgi:DNA polymerase-4/DNA polymerase V
MDPLFQDCTVLHVDADGFFASVEQALNPELRGRPVVTGAERGIIAAASYEAKALGVKRGLQLHEARRLCPGLVVLPSDYEAYSLYSERLFAILRRFTPLVEEYSIDEAFADFSGCGRLLGRPLESLAAELRQAVSGELGLTVSVGISLTKTLAKLCSKFRKPNGQTVLRREHIALLLARTPVDKIWRLGPASAEKLRRLGVATALDFARLDESAVLRLLHKPGHETWHELHGRRRLPLALEAKARYDSMMKGHTFSPASADPRLVFAEAQRNFSRVFAKLRRHAHLARGLGLCLRGADFEHRAAYARLPADTDHDAEAAPHLRALFDALFEPSARYRATLVWLDGLTPQLHRQLDLFADTPQRRALARLDAAVDRLAARYGQGVVGPAAALDLRLKPEHARDAQPARHAELAPGEDAKRRLALPRLAVRV